jgi:hypothetical protein
MSTPQYSQTDAHIRSPNSTHHRIAALQFQTAKRSLFLRQGQLCRLQLLQRSLSQLPNRTAPKRPRTYTESTLVESQQLLQDDKRGEGKASAEDADVEDQILTLPNIGNINQLDEALKTQQELRALFIGQEHSYSRVSITQDMFESICNHFDVFDALKDTMMYMGFREQEAEIAPLRLRWQSLKKDNDDDDADALGWECSYCLRYIEENHRPGERPWSLRQFAVYNKVERAAEEVTWIFVSLPNDLVGDFKDFANEPRVAASSASIVLHMWLTATAQVYWRPYIVYLTRKVDTHVS